MVAELDGGYCYQRLKVYREIELCDTHTHIHMNMNMIISSLLAQGGWVEMGAPCGCILVGGVVVFGDHHH